MNARDESPILLVGAGVAGITAAIWLSDFGVPFDWIDTRQTPGGILHKVHNRIDDYPGGTFQDGPDLAHALSTHLQRLDLQPRRATLHALECDGSDLRCTIGDAAVVHPEHLLLATGTQYRQLCIPGEQRGLKEGRISQSATADAPRFRGRHVAVVGGGDSAFENALILSKYDCRVTLFARNPNFKARPAFVDSVTAAPGITIAPIPSEVTRVELLDDGCRLHVDQRGAQITCDVAALFVRIGVDPALPEGSTVLDRDRRGFLRTDSDGRTSHRRIFAAGDIVATPLRSVATAVGAGARTARALAVEYGAI